MKTDFDGTPSRRGVARPHFAWIVLALAPLVGCGGGGGDDPPPAQPPAEQPPPQQPPAQQPPPQQPPPQQPPPAGDVPPRSATAVPIDDGHAIGTFHWDVSPGVTGDTPDGGQGQDVGDLPCFDTMDTTFHIHSHLSIFLNGEQLRVPNQLGIVTRGPGDICLYQLHTHDASGMVHLEGPAPRTFTLGQLFAVWGQPLSRTNVAGLIQMPVEVYLADEDGTITRYTDEDLGAIEFASHREITIQVGTPITEIPHYTWEGE